MDTLRLETMSMRPHQDAAAKEREHAAKVAAQFESVFVRTLVSSLRQTSAIGDGGGMFGGGPGADVYGDWFDQNLAEQIGRSGDVGIARTLMKDFERAGAIGAEAADDHARQAKAAADRTALTAMHNSSRLGGGIDVVH